MGLLTLRCSNSLTDAAAVALKNDSPRSRWGNSFPAPPRRRTADAKHCHAGLIAAAQDVESSRAEIIELRRDFATWKNLRVPKLFSRVADYLGYRVRRWPVIHRVSHWLRRTFCAAMIEAFWELARWLCANSAQFGPPVKTFSVYQALRCGWPRLNGRIVLHDQGVPQVTGDSMLARSGMSQHAEQPWPVFWSEHSNARLVTESLAYVAPGKELCLESVYGEKRWRTDSASRFLRLPPPIRLAGNWTSIISRWTPNQGVPVYGHWLHDALPRLALLPEFPPDTRILVPPDLAPYQRESLELMGVWDRCRPTPERHVEVEHYFFSAPTSMITCYNPYSVEFLRATFLPRRDPSYSGPRKFFFQRTVKRRAVENNEELAEFFRGQGWGVVKDMDLELRADREVVF
jgi:hypothetical protein